MPSLLTKILGKMSLRKRAAKDDLKAPSFDYFNQQVSTADSRLANATETPKAPYATSSYSPLSATAGNLISPYVTHSYTNPSAFASSPAKTPVKTPTHDEDDLLPEFPNMARSPSPPSHHDEDYGPPTKRAKLDYEDREAAETDDSVEFDDSPTPTGPSSNRLTMIGSYTLAKLREDKANLLAANNEVVRDNVKLRKKLGEHDKTLAENDVLKVENKGLESSLERQDADNEELQVQLAQLQADKTQLQRNCDWYANQDAELRQQLQRGNRELAQLQRDYEALVAVYNELHARTAPAPAPSPEPELEFDLARGFERYG